jgi:hypothetical protein
MRRYICDTSRIFQSSLNLSEKKKLFCAQLDSLSESLESYLSYSYIEIMIISEFLQGNGIVLDRLDRFTLLVQQIGARAHIHAGDSEYPFNSGFTG